MNTYAAAVVSTVVTPSNLSTDTICLIAPPPQFIGGSVANFGGDFTCEAGSLFFKGVAERTGDGGLGGGIYNNDGGVVT